MQKTPEAFNQFGRGAIVLLHTAVDTMLARNAARGPVEWEPVALLEKIRGMARKLSVCASEEAVRTLLRGDYESSVAICWLNSALSPLAQMNAMHLAFDRAANESAVSPWLAFPAYLTAMCEVYEAEPDITDRN